MQRSFDLLSKVKTMILQSKNSTTHERNGVAGVRMRSIGEVPSDYKNPSLRRWRVIEVVLQNGSRSRHVWGHDVTNDAGRASSAIREFNLETMTVVTLSSRIY